MLKFSLLIVIEVNAFVILVPREIKSPRQMMHKRESQRDYKVEETTFLCWRHESVENGPRTRAP